LGGPLTGLRVLELAGMGPAPHAAMLLADLGAEVVQVERPGGPRMLPDGARDHVLRGRRSVALDLKDPDGLATALRLADRADVLIEGYRPGVAERLGIGPDVCLERNPRLVYGRMTGWGQDGPLARRAGHDINFVSVTGALHAIGHAGSRPALPLNLVGDLGGGSMFLVTGILAALWERERSGLGQVVDAAMVDGASLLATMFSGMLDAGSWREERGVNILDGGAPWYDSYETADGKFVAIGAIEPKFFAELLQRLEIDPATLPRQHDRAGWPAMRERFAAAFRSRSREQWCAAFDGSDACFAPVLTFSESRRHPHVAARGGAIELAGIAQPAPAPRFARTPGGARRPPPERGEGGTDALRDWGFDAAAIEELARLGLGSRG
jgi:alpha-methylacyl-CoA racemase